MTLASFWTDDLHGKFNGCTKHLETLVSFSQVKKNCCQIHICHSSEKETRDRKTKASHWYKMSKATFKWLYSTNQIHCRRRQFCKSQRGKKKQPYKGCIQMLDFSCFCKTTWTTKDKWQWKFERSGKIPQCKFTALSLSDTKAAASKTSATDRLAKQGSFPKVVASWGSCTDETFSAANFFAIQAWHSTPSFWYCGHRKGQNFWVFCPKQFLFSFISSPVRTTTVTVHRSAEEGPT